MTDTDQQLRRDAQLRVLELRSLARELWEDSFLDPAAMSELRTVLSALTFIEQAFANTAPDTAESPVVALAERR